MSIKDDVNAMIHRLWKVESRLDGLLDSIKKASIEDEEARNYVRKLAVALKEIKDELY